MVFLDIGRSGLSLAWAGSMTLPDVISAGSGSGAISVNTTGLRNVFHSQGFTTRDIGTAKQVTFTSDFGATMLSGNTVQQIGLEVSGADTLSADGIPSITFDGSSELQVQITIELF